MQRLRNLLRTDDGQLSDFAIIALLFLGGQISSIIHDVGHSI